MHCLSKEYSKALFHFHEKSPCIFFIPEDAICIYENGNQLFYNLDGTRRLARLKQLEFIFKIK